MSFIMRSVFPDLMEAKGYWNAVITEEARKEAERPESKLFQRKKSSKSLERFKEVVGLATMQLTGEGEDARPDTIVDGYSAVLEPDSYSKVITITREAWDDEQYGVFKKYGAMMARAERETRSILACTVLNNAFTSTGPDGQYVIDTDHPFEDGSGTRSNKLSSNGVLSLSNIESLYMQMAYTKDGRGKYLMIKPKYLVVPTALKIKAHKILETRTEPFSMDNTKNVMSNMGLQIVCLPWLSSSTAWFLVWDQVDSDAHPLKFIDRLGLETDLEYVFIKNNAIRARGYFRAKYGVTGHIGIAGSTGA